MSTPKPAEEPRKPTMKQLVFLERMGVDHSSLTFDQASDIIKKAIEKYQAKEHHEHT